LTDLLKILKY